MKTKDLIIFNQIIKDLDKEIKQEQYLLDTKKRRVIKIKNIINSYNEELNNRVAKQLDKTINKEGR